MYCVYDYVSEHVFMCVGECVVCTCANCACKLCTANAVGAKLHVLENLTCFDQK